MTLTENKQSYTVPCSSAFRDQVSEIAWRLHVNVADLARGVLLTLPRKTVAAFPDPGEPDRDDRETIVLKSGIAKGRPWRRKPRLQIRMAPGYHYTDIRRALGIALALHGGHLVAHLDDLAPDGGKAARKDTGGKAARKDDGGKAARKDTGGKAATKDNGGKAATKDDDAKAFRAEALEELDRLRAIVSVLSSDILSDGVRTREDGLYIFGLPPRSTPNMRAIRNRFRILATIHHPDGQYGNTERMSQINAAMLILTTGKA